MAAELVTPVDKLSGLPSVITPLSANPDTTHHAFHPADNPIFESVSGMALRSCFLQEVTARYHNYGRDSYHALYRGPALPQTDQEHFTVTFFASAGALPRFCVDFSSGSPVERALRPDEIELLKRPHPLDHHIYNHVRLGYELIRNFFGEYVLQQDVRHEVELIDQFLNSDDEAVVQTSGLQLLTEAARVATDTLKWRYHRLGQLGLLHPKAWESPVDVVLCKLGNEEKRARLLPKLAASLYTLLETAA